MYDIDGNVEQLHDVARFNLGIVCSFCIWALYAASQIPTRGTAGRVN